MDRRKKTSEKVPDRRERCAIVGGGVVGTSIAYELSTLPNLEITLLEADDRAGKASTGAALGVLMGVISHKVSGRSWRLRELSLQRYRSLLPELRELTGLPVTQNDRGIVKLCLATEELTRWEKLASRRQQQGWQLEIQSANWLKDRLPQVAAEVAGIPISSAIYSPQDSQINPRELTAALVAGCLHRGVNIRYNHPVETIVANPTGDYTIVSPTGDLTVDRLVIASALGTSPLMWGLGIELPIKPVLGQAIRVKVDCPLADWEPTLTVADTHLVPLGNNEYWIGATVEFGDIADSGELENLWQRICQVYPALANATIIERWQGLRPRPHNIIAPILQPLDGHSGIFIATGHYRNGILLAPATASIVKDWCLTKR